jgi:hypothetical protein
MLVKIFEFICMWFAIMVFGVIAIGIAFLFYSHPDILSAVGLGMIGVLILVCFAVGCEQISIRLFSK